MSEEQLSALLAKLNDDAGFREKLQGAADLDAVVAMAKEAGFDVSKADWLRYQANQTLELSDEELEVVTGGSPTVALEIGIAILTIPTKYDCPGCEFGSAALRA